MFKSQRIFSINKWRYEPAHKILVLIASARREGSDDPVPLHSLTRVFAAKTHKVVSTKISYTVSFVVVLGVDTPTSS